MDKYWRDHWEQHVEKAGENPFEQVARTLNQEPMSEEMFQEFTQDVIKKLDLKKDHNVLDLCCGNGLLSVEIASHSRQVVGIDFNEKLVNHSILKKTENFTGIVSDVLDVQFQSESFDRVIMAAALQLFTYQETIYLFKNIYKWLKKDGILLITDITDNARIWNFFDTEEREQAYFNQTLDQSPILGTWFDQDWLRKLAKYSGFNHSIVLDQPRDYWYSHYRFNLLCSKSGRSKT